MGLSKSQIMAAKDVIIRPADVPEWGGSVSIKSVSGKVRAEFEQVFQKWAKGDIDGAYPTILALTLCDDDGNLLFTKDEVDELGNKNGEVIARLVKVAFEVNGIGGQAVAESKGN